MTGPSGSDWAEITTTTDASTGQFALYFRVETDVERSLRCANFCADMAMRHGLHGNEEMATSWARTADVHAFAALQLDAAQRFAKDIE